MDIVVTIPKQQVENFKQELLDLLNDLNLIKKFKLSKTPTWRSNSDSIYFVLDGGVKYRANIINWDYDDFTCETTGNKWSGFFVECRGFVELYEVIPIKGFQGFRYRWW